MIPNKALRLGLLFAMLCLTVPAQAAPAHYRIGILSGMDGFASMADGFRAKMAELGYIEGKNVSYDFRKTNADPVAAKKIIEEFVSAKVDLLYVFPSEPAMLAKLATANRPIPVVFSFATLEGVDLIQNTRRPGGNITGVRYPAPELTVKRFELLQEFLPRLKRLAVFYDSTYPSAPSAVSALRQAAYNAGVRLDEYPVTSLAELEQAARCEKGNCSADAVLMMPDLLTQAPRGWTAVNSFAARRKIPIVAAAAYEVDSDALFSYVSDNVETGRMAGAIAAKILHGIPPGDIAIETPESRFCINYRQARKLGIAIPPGLLSRADKVIR